MQDQSIDSIQSIVTEPVRGRYAPSPSGDLHLGNLRTALLAWLYARAARGQFILRIEDLDRPRMRPGATQRIIEDLAWLGLTWDEGPDIGGPYASYVQSERQATYQHYLQELQRAERIYPCYCTRAEIAQRAQQEGFDGPRYTGTCRHLSSAQRRVYERSGRRPALRFRVDDERCVHFTDQRIGPQEQQVQQEVGDFIVQRSDGIVAYQFAVVVDDGLMRISQVVRGADLLSSTARQILLYEALGFPIPTFLHVPLLLDEHGERMAKRHQSAGLTPLQKTGRTADDVIGQLAASCGLIKHKERISAQALLTSLRKQ